MRVAGFAMIAAGALFAILATALLPFPLEWLGIALCGLGIPIAGAER